MNKEKNATASDSVSPSAPVSIQPEASALPQWVSVEERMPEPELNVLVAYQIRDLWKRCIAFYSEGDGVWYDHYERILKYVTHWMPLPLPPG